MENQTKHRLNGDPTASLRIVPDQVGNEEAIEKPKKQNKFIKGIKKMAKPIMSLINNVASKINSLIDMVSKIHFAAPYLIIIAALHYAIIPTTPMLLAWLSFLSGGSIALLCLVLWSNSSRLDYLYKQKWGVFWIISAQTLLQIMTINEDMYPGQIFGGLTTLASLPFYIYFNFKCEDKNYEDQR